MTKCMFGISCLGFQEKAEYLMKVKFAVMDERKTVLTKKICKLCYKKLNPEGLDSLELQSSEMGNNLVRMDFPTIPEKYAVAPMIAHFRKIRRH